MDVFKLIKNPFIKIKKQLLLANLTLAMYKSKKNSNVWCNTYTNVNLTKLIY